jgi:hypothetical protein
MDSGFSRGAILLLTRPVMEVEISEQAEEERR